MAIHYTAGNAEARTYTVLPAGEYSYRVLNAEEKKARSSGNDMIELKLDVFVNGGAQGVVYDNLVFTPKAQWKVDQFLKSCGQLPEEGTEVELTGESLIGHEGRLKLKVGKTDKGNDRNEVEAYLWDDEDFS